MEDFGLGAVGHADWYAGRAKDDARKRSKHPHAELPEEPVDEVILSSDVDADYPAGEEPA